MFPGVMGAGSVPDPNGAWEERGLACGCRVGPRHRLPQGGLRAGLGQNGETASGKPSDLTIRRSMVNFV